MIRTWYLTMERIVGVHLAPLKSTVVKVSMDQLGFAPLFNGTFLIILGTAQGHTMAELNQKLRAEYVDVMLANWKVRERLCELIFFI